MEELGLGLEEVKVCTLGLDEVKAWGRSDVGELEGSGAGSRLRASEGGRRGPSAGNWFLGGVVL